MQHANTHDQQNTHRTETPAHILLRLERLRGLVEDRADSYWGRSHIEETLSQDPKTTHAQCPRYAGILEESGDQSIILAETTEQLASDMGDFADAEIPIFPVELIDLDTEEQQPAYRQTTIRFIATA